LGDERDHRRDRTAYKDRNGIHSGRPQVLPGHGQRIAFVKVQLGRKILNAGLRAGTSNSAFQFSDSPIQSGQRLKKLIHQAGCDYVPWLYGLNWLCHHKLLEIKFRYA
jgi:hypothetical protein